MKTNIFLLIFAFSFTELSAQSDSIIIETILDSALVEYNTTVKIESNEEVLFKSNEEKIIDIVPSPEKELILKRMQLLDKSSPMDFAFNEINYKYIQKYLGRDIKLISRMLGVSPYYFPMMEQQLDRFQIPLELKYLAIVESALNPKARSYSGATGLWQFMYPTGKEYGLEVTSYIDERQDPLKSTEAACIYFVKLYEMFGDWNLVLAAYNGGPGYLKRVMDKTELTDYWDLRPHLRKETQGYVPAFIAVSYVMNFYKEHDIEIYNPNINFTNRDTISFQKLVPYNLFSEMFCVSTETLNYLNPSFKKELLLKGEVICLPEQVIMDIVRNEEYFYVFLERVYNREILINEERVVYSVEKGDYLGKIAKTYNISVPDIKEWNKLFSDNLSIGDTLILYVPKT